MKRMIRVLSLVLAFLLLAPCFASCGGVKRYDKTFFFMDTTIAVTLYSDTKELADAGFYLCEVLLSALDRDWSKEKETSLVSKINSAGTEPIELDSATAELLTTALAVSKASNGAFDITVKPLVDLWKVAEEKQALPSKAEMDSALASVGYEKLILTETTLTKADPQTEIDLGGIGKGAAISSLISELSELPLYGGLVSFGSNVAVFGEKPDGSPFRVAIRDPKDESGRVGVLTLSDGEVLSVSGDYERYIEIDGVRYHHILDPETGYPFDKGLSSVAVVAKDGALADALSTALFGMGKDEALALYSSGVFEFEALLIASDGSLTATDGMHLN